MAEITCNCAGTSALSDLEFIGGAAVTINFPSYLEDTGGPLDLTGHTANFALVKDTNWRGAPVLSKAMTITAGDDGVANVLHVELATEDTLNLSGRYIYQISVMGDTNDVPRQGIIHIINNINKGFFAAEATEEQNNL